MCGIAGIISLEGVNPADLQKMSALLQHRGPDDEGFLLLNPQDKPQHLKGNDTIARLSHLAHIKGVNFQTTATLGLVHRRLSIIDLSPAGHQPMSYANDTCQLVFNGEIYNYKELRETLRSKGIVFKTDTDTEVILAAYAHWGEACVQQFIGMWAFALYDTNKQQLFLSRDRFGIKPLYYSLHTNKLAFASEIKALLALNFIKPEADMPSVYEYIAFGATANPSANLFKQIQCLPPSHNMRVDIRDLKTSIENYYDLEQQVNNYPLPPHSQMQTTFTNLLTDSIQLHLRSDVPIGSALSGGLDSSTLVAIASSKMNGTTFKTFTASYHEKNIDESHYAKLVTNALPNTQAHYTYPQINDYWADLEKLTWHQDLPINSTSMFAQWQVMKLAKEQNIKVLLDGQGADEILGGYYNFAGIYLIELLKQGKLAAFFSERKQLKTNFTPAINSSLGRAFYYFLPPFMQRTLRAKKRLGMGFINDSYQRELNHISVPERGGKSFKQQSLLSMAFGLQDLLRYEDRNSMAHSIESRVPFLDHRLVEFSIALNNNWKIKNGYTKFILRKTAEPLLPKEVVWRKDKMGFLTPQKNWKASSQKELHDFINQTTIPPFLNKEYITNLCSSDLTNSSHLSEFWKIISFLKWAQIFQVTF
ncbi:MAG TPA: asparagine synthase (glutamine-hydrolyzing) [Bacteroidia bacterium]